MIKGMGVQESTVLLEGSCPQEKGTEIFVSSVLTYEVQSWTIIPCCKLKFSFSA